jgi:hypothetical protein
VQLPLLCALALPTNPALQLAHTAEPPTPNCPAGHAMPSGDVAPTSHAKPAEALHGPLHAGVVMAAAPPQ